MSGTLVFVHGTGVRRPGLEQTWKVFTERAVAGGIEDLALARSDWGSVVGPDLDRIDKTLPEAAAPEVAPADDANSAAAWSLLIADPWFELAVVAEGAQRSALPPGASPEDDARRRANTLAGLDTPAATDLLERAGVSALALRSAGGMVSSADEFSGAVRKMGGALDEDLVEAIARAIVAAVLAAIRDAPPGEQPLVAFDRGLRQQVVDAVAHAYAPETTRGITDWVKDKVTGFASRLVTSYTVPRRRAAMGLASPAIADILFYQRRGDVIRDYVARDIAGREQPVIAVGHSLGGVILVDLLSAPQRPKVDLLVTVGSQAPLFYAIDALVHLRPGGDAVPFEPWVNIYNREDLLSFCAERTFPGRRIVDFELDAGVPFPESHSAYWARRETFDTIREAIDTMRRNRDADP